MHVLVSPWQPSTLRHADRNDKREAKLRFSLVITNKLIDLNHEKVRTIYCHVNKPKRVTTRVMLQKCKLVAVIVKSMENS